MRYLKFLPVILLILAPCLKSNAEETKPYAPPTIKVEVIVFKYLQANTLGSEWWSDKPFAPDLTNTVELTNEEDTEIEDGDNFKLLPPKDQTLDSVVQKLRHNPNYDVLLHVAWKQPISDSSDFPAVHVFAGQSYGNYNMRWREGNELDSVPAPLWEVNGKIKVVREKFYNIQVNLLLTEPLSNYPGLNLANDHSRLIAFKLNQTRRTRLGELNFFDHPFFGVLVKVGS